MHFVTSSVKTSKEMNEENYKNKFDDSEGLLHIHHSIFIYQPCSSKCTVDIFINQLLCI